MTNRLMIIPILAAIASMSLSWGENEKSSHQPTTDKTVKEPTGLTDLRTHEQRWNIKIPEKEGEGLFLIVSNKQEVLRRKI